MKKMVLIVLLMALLGIFVQMIGSNSVFAQDKYGGILKVAEPYGTAGMFGDPLDVRVIEGMYAGYCLQTLVKQEKGTLVPVLAESWQLTPDRKAFIFKLRRGVKFHDGTDFNAQAVKWNMDRVIKKEHVPANVTSVDVIDDYTVRMNFSAYSNMILNDLALVYYTFIISPTAYEKNGEKWAKVNPVGTGPFKFKETKRNQYVEYERFDKYWEKGLPYLDGLKMVAIEDMTTRVAALKAGEVDGAINLDASSTNQLKKEGRLNVYIGYGNNYNQLFFNSKDPTSIFADKRVRQAVEYAIDKEKMMQSLGEGLKKASYLIIPAAPEVPDKVLRRYDPQKAKKLLAEAGYLNGFKCVLNAPIAEDKDLLTAIQSYLAKVGIEVTFKFNSRPAHMGLILKGGLGKNEILFGFMAGREGVPLYAASIVLASGSGQYVDMARTPGFDDLIKKALVEPDPQKVIELARQMEKLTYEDAMHVPLYDDTRLGAFSPSVHDYNLWLSGTACHDFSRTWITKK